MFALTLRDVARHLTTVSGVLSLLLLEDTEPVSSFVHSSLVNLGLSQDASFVLQRHFPQYLEAALPSSCRQRFLEKSLLSVPQVRFLVLLERSPGMRR